MGEPFETSEALLRVVGLGGRFICNGFIGEDEYWEVSIPGRAGRFDGKGGGWRDILSRCGPLLPRLSLEARLLCNRFDAPPALIAVPSPFFVLHRVKGRYAPLGKPVIESLDCRE